MLRPARASSMRRRRYSGAYGGCVRGMGNLLFYFSPIPSTKAGQLQKFVAKLTDVIALYLNPPERALVLCVDEKSQIQALDRTQPGLQLKKGRCGTMTHDYKRNGTTTLFAAIELLEGKVIGQCYQRHRHQEFLRFLRRLDQEFPATLGLHLVIDNYGTHRHPEVAAWLKRIRVSCFTLCPPVAAGSI